MLKRPSFSKLELLFFGSIALLICAIVYFGLSDRTEQCKTEREAWQKVVAPFFDSNVYNWRDLTPEAAAELLNPCRKVCFEGMKSFRQPGCSSDDKPIAPIIVEFRDSWDKCPSN